VKYKFKALLDDGRTIKMPESPMEGPYGLHAIERWLHGIVVKENHPDNFAPLIWYVKGYDWPDGCKGFCELIIEVEE